MNFPSAAAESIFWVAFFDEMEKTATPNPFAIEAAIANRGIRIAKEANPVARGRLTTRSQAQMMGIQKEFQAKRVAMGLKGPAYNEALQDSVRRDFVASGSGMSYPVQQDERRAVGDLLRARPGLLGKKYAESMASILGKG